jgi:hypothetical protein
MFALFKCCTAMSSRFQMMLWQWPFIAVQYLNKSRLTVRSCWLPHITSDTSACVMADIAPADYAAVHVPRPLNTESPSRDGGLSVIRRESITVRRHPPAACVQAVDLQAAELCRWSASGLRRRQFTRSATSTDRSGSHRCANSSTNLTTSL